MAAGKSVNDILAGAKQTLAHVNEFTNEAHRAADAAAPAVKHEFSHAPYTLVKKPTTPTIGDELGARKTMVDKAEKALE